MKHDIVMRVIELQVHETMQVNLINVHQSQRRQIQTSTFILAHLYKA